MGDEDSSGGGKDPENPRFVDTKNFTNTASKDDFISKGKEVDGYFDLSETRAQFASGGGNPQSGTSTKMLFAMAEEDCTVIDTYQKEIDGRIITVETFECVEMEENGSEKTCYKVKESENGQEISVSSSCSSSEVVVEEEEVEQEETEMTPGPQAGGDILANFMPYFAATQNCDDAFTSFETIYTNAKAEFDRSFSSLTNPGGFNLTGIMPMSGNTELNEQEDNANAISYEFTAPESQEGFSVTGKISGAADETRMLLKQNIAVEMDMSKMPGIGGAEGSEGQANPDMKFSYSADQAIAVNTKAKVIEIDVNTQLLNTMGEMQSKIDVQGKLAVSAGEEKFIYTSMNMSMPAGEDAMNIHFDINSKIVDDELIYGGVVKSEVGGESEQGTFGFKLVRNAEGVCEVKDFINTLPENVQLSK
jgi:hypothetical protein